MRSNPSGNSSIAIIDTSDFTVESFELPGLPFFPTSNAEPIAVAEPGARIAGRVTARGVAVAGAIVQALGERAGDGTATSNAAGDYSVYGLVSGRYDLEVSAPGFGSKSVPGQVARAGRITLVHVDLAEIFTDGFESGDLSSWSSQQP